MKKCSPKERHLQPWNSSVEDASLEPLGYYNADANWDQFKANEQKFGYVKNPIHETTYTTPLDKNSAFYQSKIEEAERLSKEILASPHSNPHVLEEREEFTSQSDHHIDEKKYASVCSTIVRSSGAYVPPSLRNKGHSALRQCAEGQSIDMVMQEEMPPASPETLISNVQPSVDNDIKSFTVEDQSEGPLDNTTSQKQELTRNDLSSQTVSADASSSSTTYKPFSGISEQSMSTGHVKKEANLDHVKLNINAPEFRPKRSSFAFRPPVNFGHHPGYYPYASPGPCAIPYYDSTGAIYFPNSQYSYYYNPPGTPYDMASSYAKHSGTRDTPSQGHVKK